MSLVCDLCEQRKVREDFSEEGTLVTSLTKETEDGRVTITEITLDVCDDCLKKSDTGGESALLASLAGAAKLFGAPTSKKPQPRKPRKPAVKSEPTGSTESGADSGKDKKPDVPTEKSKPEKSNRDGGESGVKGAKNTPVTEKIDPGNSSPANNSVVDPGGPDPIGAGASTLGVAATPPGGDDSEGDGDGRLADEF